MNYYTVTIMSHELEDDYTVYVESASEVSAIRDALDVYQNDGRMEQIDRVIVTDI